MNLLYDYFVSGIADSGIQQFGGDICFNEIPPVYHYTVSITFGLLSIYLTWKLQDALFDKDKKIRKVQPNTFERIYFWLGVFSLVLTLYYKVITKRGFFILNPCHVTLLMMLILLRAEDNSNHIIRKFYTIWTAWLFGAFGALYWPHLEDIEWLEFILYYVEHLIIFPLGPIVLYRRYGQIFPSFKSQIASYSTVLIFQLLILTMLSRAFKVNLNFTLCHSPAQPFFPAYGYHYYTIEIFNVCLVSYVIRLISFIYVKGFYKLWSLFVEDPHEKIKQT